MQYRQYRLAKRDGEIIQQWRWVTTKTRNEYPLWKFWRISQYIVEYDYSEWYDEPIVILFTFHVGDRVKVLQTAGFHKGATGEVQFIEPSGKVWVLRDNSNMPVYYHPDELELIWRPIKPSPYATNKL